MVKRLLGVMMIVLSVALAEGSSPASAQDGFSVSVDAIVLDSGYALHVLLSPDGATLATYENIILLGNVVVPAYLPITLVDVSGDTPIIAAQLVGQTDYVCGASFTPDSVTLVTLHCNGDLNVWDVAGGKRVNTIYTPLMGPGVRPLYVMPDGVTVTAAGASLFPQILLWDISSGYMTRTLTQHFISYEAFQATYTSDGRTPDPLAAYTVSPDGSMVVAATGNGNIWVWDTATGERDVILQTEEERPTFTIRRVLFSPDGTQLYFHNHDDGSIHVWDTSSWSEVDTLPIDTPLLFDFVPDGSILVWVDEEGTTLSLMIPDQPDALTEFSISELLGRIEGIDTAAFSMDGRAQSALRLMATGGNRIALGGFRDEVGLRNLILILTVEGDE